MFYYGDLEIDMVVMIVSFDSFFMEICILGDIKVLIVVGMGL